MKKTMISSRILSESDIKAAIFQRIYNMRRALIHNVYTSYMRLLCRLKGVSLGNIVAFNGYTHIDRYRFSIIKIGNGCTFNSDYHFNQLIESVGIIKTSNVGAEVIIGDNSGFSSCRLICDKFIHIGNNVTVGANTVFRDGDDHPELTGTESQGITVCDNAFIGMNCVILKGVTIGSHAIIAAGSVVTRDVPDYCMAAGVPCKVIRSRI